jgi:hypothetical protein
MDAEDVETCYLCGAAITSDRSDDHVPPKQFFPESIRAQFNLSRLITIPAHGKCNTGFSKDEEYFTWALGSIATNSPVGRALVDDKAASFRAGKAVGLGLKILQEFDARPSGLHLPHGLVVKKVEGARLVRVVWKIVRGLYFFETASILGDNTPHKIDIIEPVRLPQSANDPVWEAVKAQPSKGVYGAIFDYKYLDIAIDDLRLHLWGLLLWDQVMIFVAHHHP